MVTAKRARLLGVLMIAVVFAVGGLTGAATMHVVEGDEKPRMERQGRGAHDLFERLQLTPEQQVQVQAIMEEGRAEMDAFWAEHRPTLRAITDSTRTRIRAVLTPEQRALDDEWLAERRRESDKRGGEGRGGRDGR